MSENPEIFADQLLGYTLPTRNARGRLVRLDRVISEILSAHAYPPPIALLLAEALVLCALMGGLLKGEGTQMTMQAQTEAGAVRLLVCDYRGGEMRGYVDFDRAALAELGANPSLFALFGTGYLAITFDAGPGKRYQGIVPLEGDSLAAACERYFVQSEQVLTLIRVAVKSGPQGLKAGGLLVQHLPEGEVGRERLHVRETNPDWDHVQIIAGSVSHSELVDPGLSMEAILWRLFHEEEEILVQTGEILCKGCRCTVEHYETVIKRFSPEERDEMRNDAGEILVDCAFCSRQFKLNI